MNTGILVALIAGIILLLLGMGLALYFLLSGEEDNTGDDGNNGNKTPVSKPSSPQKLQMKYKRPIF